MIEFILNSQKVTYTGDTNQSLLTYLRNEQHITSPKDGCSGEGTCGACLVDINGKPKLACKTKLSDVHGAEIHTVEGIEEKSKTIIAQSFVDAGAVQCGFCTPGLVMRTFLLLQGNPEPTIDQIKKAISTNLCRCTGYIKIIDAVQISAKRLQGHLVPKPESKGKVGERLTKYQAFDTATGKRLYTDDLFMEGMLFAALKFSDHPKAIVNAIDISKARVLPGVHKIFLATDVPGQRNVGIIYNDWPLMIDIGETTNYIGDVLAGVVAESEEIARKAVELIRVDYTVLEPVVDPHRAILPGSPRVHPTKDNLLDVCKVKRGNAMETIKQSDIVAHGVFQTQRIEHAFLEKESAVAKPEGGGIILYSQSQGIYEDQRQVASLLGLKTHQVHVELLPNGGGFGGKEDLSVQGHVSLYAFLLKNPVKLTLTRQESIRMHPKRHPVSMDMTIACTKDGKLTAAWLDAVGDTGAYASVGTKVMERVAGHATGGYYFPNVELQAKTVYTNNIPSGAMRGFGANQVTFALEVLIDELCQKGGFDRWQFRYNNALVDGSLTSTGQKVYGVGIQECLLALKEDFYKARYAGIACGIKNSGVGNGMVDQSGVRITIASGNHVIIDHGWTEMGQGVQNMAIQTLCTETDINPEIIEVRIDTQAQIKTGMTTSSRGTALLGLAIIDASKSLKEDLKTHSLKDLAGTSYDGEFTCNWTNKPGVDVPEPVIHYSYGYAAQLCILNDSGEIERFIAAHDGGKIMNPLLFEGQIQGAVHMGLGYALTEDLPMKDGFLVSDRLRDLKILKATETPLIEVRFVEKADPVGPYGAKGVGEIGLVPTAGAVANAYTQFDGIRRYQLPLKIAIKPPSCQLKHE
ncbi:MAG TPA: selenium-dependent xanthine dehydrogenase [Marinilabiliales bacterium]|nr:MAG: selenium-dependent xanthine dehydrogenase [Bacteroidetes bacterium GWC2_40_13]OFX75945.1 MAG: selenium-dependent xanthine dehydrogenase [Bacteroidetes bacterium GWD2_40_43]OFX94442.1 MAG: selenium-dependent xanthine dehydrogenase [Bacteroidetes bacterium GWE2_40_63]OFY18919.1 MAG: selenium-dependent xanthine dehydrogenase [Bacteroidetes bacterium GWF2_40_13]OFZ28854.1 MAG: selenium-dependent xanthine dehydrogenase [Bacteroidetes bacterium RIFOXYC2_FULL_40_12]HAN00343.1 selenium-depende